MKKIDCWVNLSIIGIITLSLVLTSGCLGGGEKTTTETSQSVGGGEKTTTETSQSADDVVRNAILLFDEGKLNEAVAEFSRSMDMADNMALEVSYLGRAMVYNELGEYPKALADYNKALELDPDYGDAYLGRAYVHSNMGNDAAVQADLERAEAAGVDLSEVLGE